jgi:transposase
VADKKKTGEKTVKEVAQQFGVSHGMAYSWIAEKTIAARRLNQGMPYWITIDPTTAKKLEKCVKKSRSG